MSDGTLMTPLQTGDPALAKPRVLILAEVANRELVNMRFAGRANHEPSAIAPGQQAAFGGQNNQLDDLIRRYFIDI